MLKLSLAVVIASINFGFYWNDPAYESFVVNPHNRLNPNPVPSIYTFDPGQKVLPHCQECAEIEKGKPLSVQELKEVLKRHVVDKDNPGLDQYRFPPYYVTK